MENDENNSKKLESFYNDSNLWKTYFRISVPVIILMLSTASYSLIDSIISTIYVDGATFFNNPNLNAADVLSIVTPFIIFMFTISYLFVVGVGLFLPNALGKKDFKIAHKIIGEGISLSLIFGIFTILLFYFLAEPWMNFFANKNDAITDEAIHQGIIYMQITTIAVAFNGIRDVIVRALRVEGKNISSALIPIIALPVNLGFDIIFMNPNIGGMGLEGAAWATVIGAFVGAFAGVAYSIYLNFKSDTYISFNLKYWVPTWAISIVIMQYGFSSFYYRATIMFFILWYVYFLNLLDGQLQEEDVVSSFNKYSTASIQIIIFGNAVASGIGQGGSVILAYHYGKKNYDVVDRGLKISFIYNIVAEGIVVIIMLALSSLIMEIYDVNIFGPINDPGSDQLSLYSNYFKLTIIGLPLILLQTPETMFYGLRKKPKILACHATLSNVVVGPLLFWAMYQTIDISAAASNPNLIFPYFSSMIIIGFVQIIVTAPFMSYAYQTIGDEKTTLLKYWKAKFIKKNYFNVNFPSYDYKFWSLAFFKKKEKENDNSEETKNNINTKENKNEKRKK
ncbi:MATE efflux family protein [Candidatus Hepatoplasma crinochetorum Av]|uniref:MATE efflux family protein n=1 Tax=Candidatus Hepatoplasma crinochetorum Av TaxID=1427984 RepID=W8GJ83_9MOLU|nr:MATE family efflux transporter [Candidatus Hepatoplasma crinochetorum]AHK22302.1 MATE efflux family protein [Candidatus Hepatoplasma crinochetorum Av]